MTGMGLCEHGRVRTTCTVCRRAIPRAPRTSAPQQQALAGPRGREDSIDRFVNALEAYIEREKNASYARFKQNLGAELPARIAAGRAIDGVEIVRFEGGDWATLRCKANNSKFRVGSSLLLHKGDPAESQPCRLISDGELEFKIGAEFRQRLKNLEIGNGWFLDEGWSDYSENLQRAIDEMRLSPRRNWVHSILSGEREPEADWMREKKARDIVSSLRLDPDQAEAFVKGYSTKSHHLIQGPPGSGKTAVLSHLAAALAAEGQRVLITAVTHRAINHALRKTQALSLTTDVVKIGGNERADDDVTTFNSYMDWRQQAVRGGVVVGATCHTRLESAFFDTVIFDEASQFPIPLAIRGMFAGKRYVFIGDDQQMDPVVAAEHTPAWSAWSVFRLLKEHEAGTMLRTTYRLNDELNAFPSRAFYGGHLKPSPDAAKRRIRFTQRPQLFSILDPEVPSIIVEVPHAGATVRSPEEARLAARIALDAIRCGLPAGEVGIITPYRAQERLIKTEIAKLAGRSGIPRGLVVETVERVQGQERELTILSLTVSDLDYAEDAAEFFFRPSRFNVALTRARAKRIVLMEPRLVNARAGKEFATWVANLRAFYNETPRVKWTG